MKHVVTIIIGLQDTQKNNVALWSIVKIVFGIFYDYYDFKNAKKRTAITKVGYNILLQEYRMSNIYISFTGMHKNVSLHCDLWGKSVCDTSNMMKAPKYSLTCFV